MTMPGHGTRPGRQILIRNLTSRIEGIFTRNGVQACPVVPEEGETFVGRTHLLDLARIPVKHGVWLTGTNRDRNVSLAKRNNQAKRKRRVHE